MKKQTDFYDINSTIATALTTDPLEQDHPDYNREQVYVSLERNAPLIYVINDAPTTQGATIFVIASHEGGEHFSRERPIYPGEVKEYKNIYELRLRSTAQIAYRVTEYKLSTVR
jgi:hypothetical protein